MRKLIAFVILSVALMLPMVVMVKPVAAQEDWVTTYTDDSYYDDSYYDDTYDYGYDDSDYDTTYALSETDAAGAFAGIAATLFGGVMLVFSLIIGIASYVYCALALMKIAKRLNHENPWYAWVPILNLVLMFQLGEQNPVLLLLLLIPGVGALVVGILSIIALMKICEKRGYDKALGLLSLVPIASYVLLGILAWGKDKA